METIKKNSKKTLKTHFHSPSSHQTMQFEMGVDEAGRGPMFGRVYAGAVVLPLDDGTATFDFSLLKDSKKFTSHKKLGQVAQYIMDNAVAWGVGFQEAAQIDHCNILKATQNAMHSAISQAITRFEETPAINNEQKEQLPYLLIDGNYFRAMLNPRTHAGFMEHTTVVQGDGTYCCIAAASILAKWFRDNYIEEICNQYPQLDERYQLKKNKGYGTQAHLEGIDKYGVCQWHRRSFGKCKDAELNEIHC